MKQSMPESRNSGKPAQDPEETSPGVFLAERFGTDFTSPADIATPRQGLMDNARDRPALRSSQILTGIWQP